MAFFVIVALAQQAQPAQQQEGTSQSSAWFGSATNLKDLAQTAAWGSAALFFLYKAISGYMFINLGVAIETRRRASRLRPGRHDLVVRIVLTKGDRATLPLGLVEICIEGDASPQRVVVNEILVNHPKGERSLNLTPGETTHFERYFDVTADSLLQIVVTIRGKRRGCWRASAVSLPIVEEPLDERHNKRLQPAALA